MFKRITGNILAITIVRLAWVFILYACCRLIFWGYNHAIIGEMQWSDTFGVIKGSFFFDSASIFYVNILFLVMSLLPFRFRERKGYQRILMWVFVVTNSAALLINIADIFYYPFKLSRIASDDLHYAGESNAGNLFWLFLKDYFWGFILWLVMSLSLYFVGFKLLRHRASRPFIVNSIVYFGINIVTLALVIIFTIVGIRGYTFSAAIFPLSMSDAALFVRPSLSSLVLSNPFCLIRTMDKEVEVPEYMSQDEAAKIFSPIHRVEKTIVDTTALSTTTATAAVDSTLIKLPKGSNVMLIILESFGTAHIKLLNPYYPKERESVTPFLDKLMSEGLLFTHAFQSGGRSIDALPSIWASIPSFKENFLAIPQSVAEYKALPQILSSKGYTTAFFHGATRSSMSFVAFGETAGVKRFYSREDYEADYGTGDFDGQWGIVDHKFLPAMEKELSTLPQPFFATLFTLSSHHPYTIPADVKRTFPKGGMEIEHAIAYSDWALENFFTEARKSKWFNNTLFIITADHGSGAADEFYINPPHNNGVPLLFYYPGDSKLKGKRDYVVSHLDVMPSLLSMLDINEEYFAFGRDAINSKDTKERYAVRFDQNVYNMITDSVMIQMNEERVTGVFDYNKDPKLKNNLGVSSVSDADIKRFKAFIQQYYTSVSKRAFTVENNDKSK